MRVNLYQKFFLWGLLNLLLIALVPTVLAAWMLFGPSDKLYPPSWFSDRIHSLIRSIATELQYKSVSDWYRILEENSSERLEFYLVDLSHDMFVKKADVPDSVIRLAKSLPRAPYELCPEPQMAANNSIRIFSIKDLHAGMTPDASVIFLYDGPSRRFWFGRPLFVMDEEENPNRMLLAVSSSSITGNGFFFNIMPGLAALLAVIAGSFCWWLPFLLHITRPIHQLVACAEHICRDDYDEEKLPESSLRRTDEIGVLITSFHAMAGQIRRKIRTQQNHLNHIAHELSSPITRIKLGLAVLEDLSPSGMKDRIRDVETDVGRVESHVQNLMAFLRAETASVSSSKTLTAMAPLLRHLVEKDGGGKDVRLQVEKALQVSIDVENVCRAVSNALRNALQYAGNDGPVEIRALRRDDRLVLEILDEGPGVSNGELPLLTSAFYRGSNASKTTGTGLGLTIVKNSVENMHGTMICQNRSPRGFAVIISIPIP